MKMLNKFNFENVNGFMLSLEVESKIESPKSRNFKITYKGKETKSNRPKISLFFAVIFNLLALFYVKISLITLAIIVTVISFLVFFWITHSVQSESVLVIPTIGIQSSVKYVYGREDNFVPWTCVDDVIINEVIKMNRVLYFLTVLVKTGAESAQGTDGIKLIPLFKYTKPRLQMIEKIYREIQSLLMESQREPAMGSGDTG